MSAKQVEEVVRHLLVEHFAAIKIVEESHHFGGGRDILASLTCRLQVHHLAAEAGVRETEGVEHRIYVFHAHPVDEDIGRAIVADRDHHRSQVAESDLGNARSQAANDPAARGQVRGLYGVNVSKLQLA